MSVTLRTGHVITFRPHYTHRMETRFKEVLNKSMTIREEDGKVIVENIRTDTMDLAAKEILPLLVEKITKDGQDVPYTDDWLLDLPEKDFATLRDAVVSLRTENENRKEAGKKIAHNVGLTLRAKGKLFPKEYALYRFCREFHCLPQDVENMQDDLYHLFRAFLREEAEADTMEARRNRQRSPR